MSTWPKLTKCPLCSSGRAALLFLLLAFSLPHSSSSQTFSLSEEELEEEEEAASVEEEKHVSAARSWYPIDRTLRAGRS